MGRKQTELRERCPDCGHDLDAHDEDGRCAVCEDDDSNLPGGAQGAHVGPCPCLATEDEPF